MEALSKQQQQRQEQQEQQQQQQPGSDGATPPQAQHPGGEAAPGGPRQPQQRRRQQHHPLSAAGGPLLEHGAARIPDAPAWTVPDSGWVRQFVSDFQQLRRQVADAYETGGGRPGAGEKRRGGALSTHACPRGGGLRAGRGGQGRRG